MLLLLLLGGITVVLSCKEPTSDEAVPLQEEAPVADADGVLFRVGSIEVLESDLEFQLKQRDAGGDEEEARKAALAELVRRARLAQAGLDADAAIDPGVREQIGTLLAQPALEKQRARLQALSVSEDRLRELYQENLDQHQKPEQRQVAVLWLNSADNDAKAQAYAKRLEEARNFAMQNKDILNHPEKGFSILGADYSEHAASKFRGGMVGWMEAESGQTAWHKAVAAIAFALEQNGEISEVTTRKEGVFLVRVMDVAPARTLPFDAVAERLRQSELGRLRKELRASMAHELEGDYPVEWVPSGQ